MTILQTNEKASASKWNTFRKRLFSTVILLGVLGGVVAWGDMWAFRSLICFLCILSAWEWAQMFRISGKPGQPWLSFIFGAVYPVILSLACGSFMFSSPLSQLMLVALTPLPIVLLTIISFIWEMRRAIVGSRSLRSVGNTVLSFIFPGWMFAFTIPMMQILPSHSSGGALQQGVWIVLWVVLFTKMTDIFAYVSGLAFGGRLFKNRKMIPHISPKKTWEGLIGSYILSLGFGGWIGMSFGVFEGFSLASISLMTLLFLLAVAGDLAGSLIKRSLSIKDSGSLLPGIGGVFDLIDSSAFTVTVVFFIEYYLLFIYMNAINF